MTTSGRRERRRDCTARGVRDSSTLAPAGGPRRVAVAERARARSGARRRPRSFAAPTATTRARTRRSGTEERCELLGLFSREAHGVRAVDRRLPSWRLSRRARRPPADGGRSMISMAYATRDGTRDRRRARRRWLLRTFRPMLVVLLVVAARPRRSLSATGAPGRGSGASAGPHLAGGGSRPAARCGSRLVAPAFRPVALGVVHDLARAAVVRFDVSGMRALAVGASTAPARADRSRLGVGLAGPRRTGARRRRRRGRRPARRARRRGACGRWRRSIRASSCREWPFAPPGSRGRCALSAPLTRIADEPRSHRGLSDR